MQAFTIEHGMKINLPDFVDCLRACPLFLLVSLGCPLIHLRHLPSSSGTDQVGTSHAFARGRSGRFFLVAAGRRPN